MPKGRKSPKGPRRKTTLNGGNARRRKRQRARSRAARRAANA